MDMKEKQELLNKIICDDKIVKVGGIIYTIKNPTFDQKVKADILYNETIEDVKFELTIDNERLDKIKKVKGLWNKEQDELLTSSIKMLDDFKVNLYQAYMKPDQQKIIRKQIAIFKQRIESLEDRKRELSYYTIEYYAVNVRERYLISNNLYTESGKVIQEEMAADLLEQIQQEVAVKYLISLEQYRELARSEPWRSFWTISKGNVFNKNILEYTQEQKTLILYSRMYDNAFGYPSPPPDSIINDDDMFDGWLISVQRENEKEQNKKFIEEQFKVKGDGGEVFIMANKDAISDIQSLNDINTRMKIINREKLIKEQGIVDEMQLPDVKMDLQKQATEEFKRRMKNGRN